MRLISIRFFDLSMAAINRFGDTGKVYNIRVRGLYGCRVFNDNKGCAAFFNLLFSNMLVLESMLSLIRQFVIFSKFHLLFLYGLIALQSVVFKCEAVIFLNAVGKKKPSPFMYIVQSPGSNNY